MINGTVSGESINKFNMNAISGLAITQKGG